MNASARAPSSPRRQRGAASVAIAMLLMFILVAAVAAVLKMSGSSVIDAAKNEEQISALFLAESGVERAQATISSAAQGGGYTNTTCTNLTNVTAALGRGSFLYTSATSLPSSCGSGIACETCTVTVKGIIGASSRTIRTVLSTTTTEGVEGCGSQFTLNMTTAIANAAAFTNLAYRSKGTSTMCGGGGGSNAQVGTCTNTGGSCVLTSTNVNGWNLQNTGANNVSGMGVYANVPNAGTYTITDTLVDNSGNPVSRNYVQTGALFYPLGAGSVSFVGSYGMGTGGNKTTGTSSTSSSLPSGWNCAPPTNNTGSGGTASPSVAAGADTLVYGFSSWPNSATNQLKAVTLGIQPLRQKLNMTGTQGDNLYSQIWYSYNPAYYSTGSTAATNGANFTGTIGATFTGRTISDSVCAPTNRCLELQSNVGANQILSVGDQISAGATIYGTLGVLAGGTANQTGAKYILSGTTSISGNTPLLAKSNVLRLATNLTAATTGVFTRGDVITNTALTTTYGYLPTAAASGTWNNSGSTYALVQQDGITAAAQIQVSSAINNMVSAGTTITLSGATATPLAGTAIAVASGNSAFNSANVTGSISGTTLTVTSCSSGTPSNGDALFGINILAQTRIMGPLSSGAACNGTYPVNNSQTAASGSIISRAAVVSANSANSYTVSRLPTTRLTGLSGVQICGGVCAFFNAGSDTTFTLTNITSGDDWSSGFACLKGVDPGNIRILGTIVAKRSSWGEPVQ